MQDSTETNDWLFHRIHLLRQLRQRQSLNLEVCRITFSHMLHQISLLRAAVSAFPQIMLRSPLLKLPLVITSLYLE